MSSALNENQAATANAGQVNNMSASPPSAVSNKVPRSTGWARPIYWDRTFDGMVAVGMQEQARQAMEQGMELAQAKRPNGLDERQTK
jgi:hypothetical protein